MTPAGSATREAHAGYTERGNNVGGENNVAIGVTAGETTIDFSTGSDWANCPDFLESLHHLSAFSLAPSLGHNVYHWPQRGSMSRLALGYNVRGVGAMGGIGERQAAEYRLRFNRNLPGEQPRLAQ